MIFRKLKKLEGVISMSILDPVMGDQGWEFGDGPGTIADTVNGKRRLGEIYLLANPRYTGRVSVPVLWDKKRRTIVNNESPEIIRMLNSAFASAHRRSRRLLSRRAASRRSTASMRASTTT